MNEKGGDNMQFQTLKAVKNSDSQFYVAIASIGINSEGKYEGILMIADKKKPKANMKPVISILWGEIKKLSISRLRR